MVQLLPADCILHAQQPSPDVRLLQETFRYLARSKHVVDSNNYNIKPPKRETQMLRLITGVCASIILMLQNL